MADGEARTSWWKKEWWTPDRKLGVAGVVLAVLGTLVAIAFGLLTIELTKEMRDPFNAWVSSHWTRFTVMMGVLVAVAVLSGLFLRMARLSKADHDNAHLKEEISKLNDTIRALTAERDKARLDVDATRKEADSDNQPKFPKRFSFPRDDRPRWNLIKEIKFGHLRYEPFLTYEKEKAIGLGVDLLRELLEKLAGDKTLVVTPDSIERNWNDILHCLAEGKYDVIATPLFATFDRSQAVSFTAPLFFSNVGLYIRSDMRKLFTKVEGGRVSLEVAVEKIKTLDALKVFSVKEEISESLAHKHVRLDQIEECGGRTLLSSLVKRVAGYEVTPHALFCESFYAARQEEVKDGQVINILEDHEILYPVCFAVRIGDYQLRNLLNIRLLELAKEGGAFHRLTRDLQALAKRDGETLTDEEINRHFVAEWPMKLKKDGTNG